MRNLYARKLAFYLAFAWIAVGIVKALMSNAGIEQALVKAAMPGGLLLLAALVAYSAPRIGALLITGLGVALYVFAKQDTVLMSLLVSLPMVVVGLIFFVTEIIDSRG